MAEIKLPIGFPKKELTNEEEELDDKLIMMSILVKLAKSLPKNDVGRIKLEQKFNKYKN